MIFKIKMPVDYPRIKFTVFDSNLGADEALGEANLDLGSSIALLKKDGELEDKKMWLNMTDYQKKLPAGFILI